MLKNDDNNPRISSLKLENILMDYLKTKFNIYHGSELNLVELNRIMHSFMIGFKQRW